MLISADLFAVPPHRWYEKMICKAIGAKTFHWGMLVVDDGGGWIITESRMKGVSLTRLDYGSYSIYRIRGLRGVDWEDIVSIVANYGAYPYDFDVALWTGIWWLFKHYLGKVIPVIHDKEVNCQEWVVMIANEFGVKVIPDDEYPMCVNLENSPYLEYVGELSND